ncbi:MAG: outer membrane beta-barrel protein [Alphaproteobacteria bacterium]
MKIVSFRRGLLLAVSAVAIAAVPSGVSAGYGQQGFFTGRVEPDGSIDLRNPVAAGVGAVAGQSIAQRPRPDYDPIPYDVGSFQLFPSVEVGPVFDSNIYAQKTGEKSDYVWTVRPGISAFSNWNRHALQFGAQGDFGFGTFRPAENYYDGILNMRGRLDLANRTNFEFGGDYQRLTEARGSPDNNIQAEPADFNYSHAFVALKRKQGRFDIRTQYDVSRFDYDHVKTATSEINLNFRNRLQQAVTAELGYEVMRFWRPFVRGQYDWRDFDVNSQHNSQGYTVLGGSGFEMGGGTVTGEVYAGLMSHDYRNWTSDGVGNTTSSFKFGGKGLWNITGMTSLVLEADRTLEDTTTTGYRSFIATGGSATLQHELRRNILLEAKGGMTRYDFNGAPERQDDQYNAGAGMRYFFNRHFYSDIQYDFTNRISTVGANNYDRHVVQLRFGAQM